jgi:hypothetical protein
VIYSSRAGVAKREVSRSVVVVGAADVGAVLRLSGGAHGAVNAAYAVISPRYQAKTAYPTFGGAPARPTAEASLPSGRPTHMAESGIPAAAWYHDCNLQYQLLSVIRDCTGTPLASEP